MNARAAGRTLRSRRQTSATGRWTAGAKLRTSTRSIAVGILNP